MYLLNKKIFIMISALLFSVGAYSLSSDRNKPIKITADSFTMDNSKGVSIYSGNVVMIQGTLKVTGDKLTAHTDKNKKLTKVVVIGNKATYEQLPDNQPDKIKGSAKTIEYNYDKKEYVTFLKEAHLKQKTNEFTGDRIKYTAKDDYVEASGNTPKKPVTVIIYPDEQK